MIESILDAKECAGKMSGAAARTGVEGNKKTENICKIKILDE